MDMMTRIANLTSETMKTLWPEAEGLPGAGELRGLLAVPPDPKMGDYAFPCFRLAKALRMAPPKIACVPNALPKIAAIVGPISLACVTSTMMVMSR